MATLIEILMTPFITRSNPAVPDNSEKHDVYYRNQYCENYKTDERTLKSIIRENTACINDRDQLRLIIYYKSRTTKSLISKNNLSPALPDLKKSNLVYEFKCPVGECEHYENLYIGETTTSLSRRLTMHLGQGAIQQHLKNVHKLVVSREQLVDNTSVPRLEGFVFMKPCILHERSQS